MEIIRIQNYPNATVGDVLGKKEVIGQEFSYLLGTLPYKKIATGAKYASIPDNQRHKINFNLLADMYDDFSDTYMDITKSLPELAGKKITVSYSPATQYDADTINSFLPKPHADGSPIQPTELPTSLPAYLISVKPELRIDETVVATGTAVNLGTNETLSLTFTAPNQYADKISHFIKGGEYFGIAIDLGKISANQMNNLKTKLEATKAKLEAQNFTGLTKDDILGDLLYTTALSYFAELDMMNFVQARTIGIVDMRLPSEAAFLFKLNTYSIFGIPQSVSTEGLAMDAARNLSARTSLAGDKSKTVQFTTASGMNSSALENGVPEQLFSTPANPVQGISAVKALQIANDQGIPIYTINASNISIVLPQLQVDADVKADIQNAVNAGKIVTVSKTNITFSGWTGCGYIIIEPNTGDGAYMLNGGMNGGIIYALWWVGYMVLLALEYTGILATLLGLSIVVVESTFITAFTAITVAIASLLSTAATSLLNFLTSPWFYQFMVAGLECFFNLTPLTGPPDLVTGACMAMYMGILYIARTLGGR